MLLQPAVRRARSPSALQENEGPDLPLSGQSPPQAPFSQLWRYFMIVLIVGIAAGYVLGKIGFNALDKIYAKVKALLGFVN